MNWADAALRLLLRSRDRETVSGDLLEEYREHVLPAKGPWAARRWYLRQILSFVTPTSWGLVIGAAAGTLNLLSTALEPLAEDTGGRMATWLGGLLFFWAATAFSAARRTNRVRDGVMAGILAGITTMAVLHVAAIVRVNAFLDQIQHRDDWSGLIMRFHASDFESLRTFANWEYVRQTPLLLVIGAAAGGISGALGGAIGRARPMYRATTPL